MLAILFRLQKVELPRVALAISNPKMISYICVFLTGVFSFLLFLVDGGNAISKIIFLKARAMKKDAATLAASGPQGTMCSVIHQSSSVPFFH